MVEGVDEAAGEPALGEGGRVVVDKNATNFYEFNMCGHLDLPFYAFWIF